jgi:hypothetical protein
VRLEHDCRVAVLPQPMSAEVKARLLVETLVMIALGT